MCARSWFENGRVLCKDDGVPDTSGDRGGDSGGGSSSTTTTTTTGGVPEGPDGLFDTYTWVECFQIKDPEPFFLITESRDMTPQVTDQMSR